MYWIILLFYKLEFDIFLEGCCIHWEIVYQAQCIWILNNQPHQWLSNSYDHSKTWTQGQALLQHEAAKGFDCLSHHPSGFFPGASGDTAVCI